jgi:hypothetical protein
MKYILSLLFLFSFNVSFGQITINELIKMFNMDSDQFESYAISKGYTLDHFINEEGASGINYFKEDDVNSKGLQFFTEYFLYGKYIEYTTWIPIEASNFKSSIKNIGYKLENSYIQEGVKFETYANLIYSISISTWPPKGDFSKPCYAIGIYKLLK